MRLRLSTLQRCRSLSPPAAHLAARLRPYSLLIAENRMDYFSTAAISLSHVVTNDYGTVEISGNTASLNPFSMRGSRASLTFQGEKNKALPKTIVSIAEYSAGQTLLHVTGNAFAACDKATNVNDVGGSGAATTVLLSGPYAHRNKARALVCGNSHNGVRQEPTVSVFASNGVLVAPGITSPFKSRSCFTCGDNDEDPNAVCCSFLAKSDTALRLVCPHPMGTFLA